MLDRENKLENLIHCTLLNKVLLDCFWEETNSSKNQKLFLSRNSFIYSLLWEKPSLFKFFIKTNIDLWYPSSVHFIWIFLWRPNDSLFFLKNNKLYILFKPEEILFFMSESCPLSYLKPKEQFWILFQDQKWSFEFFKKGVNVFISSWKTHRILSIW